MKQLGYKELIHYLVLIALLICPLTDFSYCKAIIPIFYSEYYHPGKTKIKNPLTEENLFPDTLIWSKGGEIKYGLRLMLCCSKINRIYKPGELIGIRTGLKNCSDKDIFLACAYYSPNKPRRPPDYTLFIDAPGKFSPKTWVYLGDDNLFDPGKPQLIKIPKGMIFNPSPDKFY